MSYDNFPGLIGVDNDRTFPVCLVIGHGVDKSKADY